MAEPLVPMLGTQYAHRSGRSIGFASVGTGPPVLLLTQFAVPLFVQRRLTIGFVAALAEHRRVLLVDDAYARADGSEGKRPVPEGFLESFVDNLDAVLDEAGIGACDVIANLVTTMPAIALAARLPERVSSLLLWAPMLTGEEGFSNPDAGEMFALMNSRSDAVAEQSYIGALGISGSAQELREQRALMSESRRRYPAAERIAVRGLAASSVADVAGSVRCPTLVVSPSAAIVPGAAAVHRVVRAIHGASLVEVDSAAVSITVADRALAMESLDRWLGLLDGGQLPPVRESKTQPAQLSERELEVLRLVVMGMTNPQIAERLTIAPSTVARHVHNILGKTGLSNRTQLADYAHRAGLLDES